MLFNFFWTLVLNLCSFAQGQEVSDTCVDSPNCGFVLQYTQTNPGCVEYCTSDGSINVIRAPNNCWLPAFSYVCAKTCHLDEDDWFVCQDDPKPKIFPWGTCIQDDVGSLLSQGQRYLASACDGQIFVYSSDDENCETPIATLQYDVSQAVVSSDGSDATGNCIDLLEVGLDGSSNVLTQTDAVCQDRGLNITLNGCLSQAGLLVPLPATFDLQSNPGSQCAGYPDADGFENLGVVSITRCDDACNEARAKGTDVIGGCCMHNSGGCYFNEDVSSLVVGPADSFAALAEAACEDTTPSCESWISRENHLEICGDNENVPQNDEGRQCLATCCGEYFRCSPPCVYSRPTIKPVEEIRTSPAPTAATTQSVPTPIPTPRPTFSPSESPTSGPTTSPSGDPSASPSRFPSKGPTSSQPSTNPTACPTTDTPSVVPTVGPTIAPTLDPTSQKVHIRVIIDEEITVEGLGNLAKDVIENNMTVGLVEIGETGFYFEVDMHFPELHSCADTADIYDVEHAMNLLLNMTHDQLQQTCSTNRNEVYLKYIYHLEENDTAHAVAVQEEMDSNHFYTDVQDYLHAEGNPKIDGVVVDHHEYWTLTDFYYFPDTDEQSEAARSTWSQKTSDFYRLLLDKSHAEAYHFHVEVLAAECFDGTWKIDTGNTFGYAEYCYSSRFGAACLSTAGIFGDDTSQYDNGKLALLVCEALGFHEGYYAWVNSMNSFWSTNAETLDSIYPTVTELSIVPEFANLGSSGPICPSDVNDVHYCQLGVPWNQGPDAAECSGNSADYLAVRCDAHPKATENEFWLYCVNMEYDWFHTDENEYYYNHAMKYALRDILNAQAWDLHYDVYEADNPLYVNRADVYEYDWSHFITNETTSRIGDPAPWESYNGTEHNNWDTTIQEVAVVYVDWVSRAGDIFNANPDTVEHQLAHDLVIENELTYGNFQEMLFKEWGTYCYMSEVYAHQEEIPVCNETKIEPYFSEQCFIYLFHAEHGDAEVSPFWRVCDCLDVDLVSEMELDAECRVWSFDQNTIGGKTEVCQNIVCQGGTAQNQYAKLEGYISRPCGTYTYSEAADPDACMRLCDAQEDCHGFNWLESERGLCSLCTHHFDVVRDANHAYDSYYFKDDKCDPTSFPTSSPTSMPTYSPTTSPSSAPTTSPTTAPTDLPTVGPSGTPSRTPSRHPSQAPTIALCSGTLIAQYSAEYETCGDLFTEYAAFPETGNPITWGSRCYCLREQGLDIAENEESLGDVDYFCRIKPWEELNLITLFYDCYGQDIAPWFPEIGGYSTYTDDDCYYGEIEHFSGYRRQHFRQFVPSVWPDDPSVVGNCIEYSGGPGEYDVERCLQICKLSECQAFNVDRSDSICQVCDGIIHTSVNTNFTAYYRSQDPGCNPTMAPTSPPSDIPSTTPTDGPSKTPTKAPTDPVCSTTELTATTYSMIDAGYYACYTELIGKLLRIEAQDWVQLTENNLCDCLYEFEEWSRQQEYNVLYDDYQCRIFIEDDRNLPETYEDCLVSRDANNCDFNGWPKIRGMRSTDCAIDLYGEQALFVGSVRECINLCDSQPACHSFNYYYDLGGCDLCSGLYSIQYAPLGQDMSYYYKGDCLSTCDMNAVKDVTINVPRLSQECLEEHVEIFFLTAFVKEMCGCLDGVKIPELDAEGEINELNYCMLSDINTVSFATQVSLCRSSVCHNGTDTIGYDLPYALIDNAQMTRCESSISGLASAEVCMEKCEIRGEDECIAINFYIQTSTGVTTCEICDLQGQEIIPTPNSQFWYKKDCADTYSPTESPTHVDCDGDANYQIYYFPEDDIDYGLSGFAAAVHDRNFYMWVEMMRTDNYVGLTQFMEDGNVNAFASRLNHLYSDNIKMLDLSRYYNRPHIDFMSVSTDAGNPMYSFVGKLLQANTALDANADLNLAIGIDSYELCHYDGYWVQNDTIPLFAYEMGGDQTINGTEIRIGTLQIQRICPIGPNDCPEGFQPVDPSGGTCYQSCEALPTQAPSFMPTESPTYTNCNGERKFHIIFQPNWDDADVTGYAPMVAAVSTKDYTMWADGEYPSTPVGQYALFGETMYLETEISEYVVPDTATMPISDTAVSEGINSGDVFMSVDIHSATEFGYISVVSRILPSPDWMVGLEHQSLCTQTSEPLYRNRSVVNAFYVDAGVSATTSVGADVIDYEARTKKIDAKTSFQSDLYGYFVIQKYNCPDYDEEFCTRDEGCMLNEDNLCVASNCPVIDLACSAELVDTDGDGCPDSCVTSHIDLSDLYWTLQTPGYLGRCFGCTDCSSTTRDSSISDFQECEQICRSDAKCRAFSTQLNTITGETSCDFFYGGEPTQVVILEQFESFCYRKTCEDVTCLPGYASSDVFGTGCIDPGYCSQCQPLDCPAGQVSEDTDNDECHDLCIPESFHSVGTRVFLTYEGVVYPGSVAFYDSSVNEYSLKLDNGGFITGQKSSHLQLLPSTQEHRTLYLEGELVEAYVNDAWSIAEIATSPFVGCSVESETLCANVDCDLNGSLCPRKCDLCERYTVNITGTYYADILFRHIRPHWMQFMIGARVESYSCEFRNGTVLSRDESDGSYLTSDDFGLLHWRDMSSVRPSEKFFIKGDIVQALMALQNRIRDGYVVSVDYEVNLYTIAFIGFQVESVDADRVYAYQGQTLDFATDEGCITGTYWCGSQQRCLPNNQGGCMPTVTPTFSPTESPTYRLCAFDELLELTENQGVVCQETYLKLRDENLFPSIDDRCRCFDTVNKTYEEWYTDYSCLWHTDEIPLSNWWTECSARTCPDFHGYYMMDGVRMQGCSLETEDAGVTLDDCRSMCNSNHNNVTCIGLNFQPTDTSGRGQCELCSVNSAVVAYDLSWQLHYQTAVTDCQEGSGLPETLPVCNYDEFASILVEAVDPSCGAVGVALHDSTLQQLLIDDPESFCTCINATTREISWASLYAYDCELGGRNFFDDFDAYCNRTVPACDDDLYKLMDASENSQCADMNTGYSQHNLPSDETQCFCFEQLLESDDFDIKSLDCSFHYPQYNLYMDQYSDHCRYEDLCTDQSTACSTVATYGNCIDIPSIRETCRATCSQYVEGIANCATGGRRKLLSMPESTARRRRLDQHREPFMKGTRVSYQTRDGYVRWKNDDGTYAIQTVSNEVHLNVQPNELNLSPSAVYSAGQTVGIQVCWHRYGTVQARNVDGSYIVVHDPIPEDAEFMKSNPLLDRVHVIGGSDIYLDLNSTISPHSNVLPSNMFELYYDPHFLLGDHVLVTVNGQEQEGIITDMDYETNRYSINFFDIDTPLYGVPYEEISYSR